jgi:glycosyltransferase involved in cell wall biosynthesis
VKVLLAGANRQVVGGAETYLRAVIPALRASGLEIALFHERIPQPDTPTVDDGAIPSWTDVARAAGWQPDVVYVHGLASPDLERQLLDRFPAVLFAHNYYGTCATGTKRHAWPHIAPCQRRLGVACLGLHYPRRCGGLNPVAALESYRVQRARRRLLDRYRAVCVASRHMRQEYARHGVPAAGIHVLPLPPTGITPDAALSDSAFGSGTVLFLGRLTELKIGTHAVDAVARAAGRLGRALALVAVGDGPQREELQRRAQHLAVRATFLPWVEPAERNRLLRAAEILLVPSTWPEPWGLVGLEAACAGVPAVAYASGGIPEWLTPGETGELAPADPPTAEGLAAAIVRALGDGGHYARLREGAWRRAREYTLERHVAGLVPVLARAASVSP